MQINEVFPSKYIKAEDLQGREPTVVIADARMEKLGDDQKLILYFQHKEKGMVTNKTNANRIAYMYGDNTDGWIGREIVLCSEFVEFQGRSVKGLRVKPPARGAASPAAPYVAASPAMAARPAPISNRPSIKSHETVITVPSGYTEINPPPPDDIPF